MNEYTSINGGGFQVPNPSYDDILLRQGYGGQDGVTAQCNLPALESSSLVSCVSITDIHNRLRTSSQISNPQSQISFVYDPLGRLVWTRTTTPGQTAVDEVWSWSGWTLLTREVLQGSSTLDTFRYTWGPDLSGSLEGAGGVGGLLSIEHAAGSSSTWDIRHVHYDANGNVIALTNSSGNISARYRYSPFGELITSQDLDSSGWNERNLHRFSTKPEVAGTGLLYYGYRWYDPATGRWPSRDPIEEAGGMNFFAFVGNSGINRSDFLGLKCTINIYADHLWGDGGLLDSFIGELGGDPTDDAVFVGCGADTLNEWANQGGFGVEDPPKNPGNPGNGDTPFPDPNLNPDDFLPMTESLNQLLDAINSAKLSTDGKCSEPDCCEAVTIKINCSDEFNTIVALLLGIGVEGNPCGTTLSYDCTNKIWK